MFTINIVDLIVVNNTFRVVLEGKPIRQTTSWTFPKDKA